MPEPVMRIAGDSNKSLPRKVVLTVAAIERAECPPGKARITLYDARVPGLALRVTSNGSKTFTLYRKVNGRPLKMKLGSFPTITIDQARTLAAKHNGSIADGKDPRDARRAIRESTTLQELYDEYKDKKLSLTATERTRVSDKSRFDTCFEDWKNRKVVTILPAHIRDKHALIARTRGHVTANRAIQLLRRLFNWKRIEPNPVVLAKVDFFQESQRERFVQADELPRFFKALDAEPNETIRDFIKLSLFTGARRSNVQSMRWQEINLDSATWTIPAEKSKSKKPMAIHLSDAATEILKKRQSSEKKSEYVFASHGKSGHLVEPKSAWARILKAANIKDLHLHDLRRTLGSWQAAAGSSLQVIGKSLGHSSVAATAIYSRLDLKPVRESVNIATAAMLATVNPPAEPTKKEKTKKERKKK